MLKGTPTLLIDADITTYVRARQGQHAYTFDEGGEPAISLDDVEEVKAAAVREIEELKLKFETTNVVLCFTDTDGNFRKVILPSYKAGRPPKPLHYYPLRDHLTATYKTYLKPSLEGDDIMGILATHPTLIHGRKIIVSLDKDMATVPGELYNPGKGKLRKVSAEEAEHFFYTQVLTGDPTDNYKGCPGIGPKRAEDILAQTTGADHTWSRIVGAYHEKGLTEADALVQARCARILHHTDYDFKRKEPILWTPPKGCSPIPHAVSGSAPTSGPSTPSSSATSNSKGPTASRTTSRDWKSTMPSTALLARYLTPSGTKSPTPSATASTSSRTASSGKLTNRSRQRTGARGLK